MHCLQLSYRLIRQVVKSDVDPCVQNAKQGKANLCVVVAAIAVGSEDWRLDAQVGNGLWTSACGYQQELVGADPIGGVALDDNLARCIFPALEYFSFQD